MAQISFEDLVNGTVPDASDFNSRYNALKNRINNGMETDNIADSSITTVKIANNAIDSSKLDETDNYAFTGTLDLSGATVSGISANAPSGSYKNLVMIRPTAATVDINVDELVVTDGTDNISLSSVDVTADITASGANGLDTDTEANSTWYYLWVIYNGTTTASLMSVSKTLGTITLPSGYTFGTIVGACYNDSSGNIKDFTARGNVFFVENTVITSGTVTQTSYADLSIATACPPDCIAKLSIYHDDGVPWYVKTKGYSGDLWESVSTAHGDADLDMLVDSSSLIQYKHTSGTSRSLYVNCYGFIFTLGA